MINRGLSKRFSIGVDLGGTNLRVAAFNSSMEVLETLRLRTRLADGPQAVISDLGDAVDSLVLKFSSFGESVGIGVGTPGPLELPRGIVRQAPNLPGWNGLNVRQAIEGRLGCPIELDCDGNTAALGEFVRGTALASDEDSFCMLTLGTGVGCGIVLRGEVWHGDHGMGGEAGHITVKPDGTLCGCGNEGCLEVYASATAVRRLAREAAAAGGDAAFTRIVQAQENFDAKDLFELACASNPTAQQIFNQAGNSLGLALAALINTLDVRVYLIGGGMASAWDAFAPTMMATIERRSYVFRGAREGGEQHMIRVQKASLGDQAGLIGAGALPFQASDSINVSNVLESAPARVD